MKKNSGFTLIELLIVIAIIGILASVVLSSLNTARTKAIDVNIKSNLANARAQAQIFYDIGSKFYTDDTNNVCLSAQGIYDVITAAHVSATTTASITNGNQTATTTNCNAAPETWAAQVPLKQPNLINGTSGVDYYCVDNSGASKIEDLPFTAFDILTGTPTACL
jgi:prepilin-type N-terminal cleavage/methylation domain-containing protein